MISSVRGGHGKPRIVGGRALCHAYLGGALSIKGGRLTVSPVHAGTAAPERRILEQQDDCQ